ncbi:phosphate-repressible na+ phosphate cotransporter [Colletotrichum karsti]|uniref:Phosphate transporter n=1 Tax=Colletotrichum karsti TaxID=1095194 RepID=A0A9P6HV27_9PEZI|nr:phosphate-repressible na+ phosphate cotransporter [Colletotrichum karsti]KAF9870964.1 phosphate-repressible na+ phosphate cotransporter [Colletotrichum karsti]
MVHIKKVVVLGATGALGEVLIPALVAANFDVACILRPGTLTSAFDGHDAVVEAFNPAAAIHQKAILEAVLNAGVRHVITPDFSGNTFHPRAGEVLIFNPKLEAQRELERVVAESDGKLSWTAIVTGPWYDWTIEKGIFWVNRERKVITRYGSGNQRYSMSRRDLNGEALVAVLSNPGKYQNRAAYFASHTVSTNQLISIVKELALEGWKVEDVPFDGLFEKAHKMWQEDTRNGVQDRLNSKAYAALSTVALLDEDNRQKRPSFSALAPADKMALHQYDYIFAIGTIFAFLDAWNIGANDVANSWATSVSSRSISYIQAMTLGSILEFVGAVGVGARVADTIRTKIVDIDFFENDPALLMLGMTCAVVASSIYLTFCTKIGLPVSTTHSIMGGVIGMGVALIGAENIHWTSASGSIDSGVVSVFLAWIIAPGLAGAFGAIIFTITKYGVMLRKNPVMKGLMLTPVYFGITASLLTMLIVWKGGSIKVNFNDAETAGMIVGVGAAWALVITIFLVPWLYRIVLKDDWQLRWWHIPLGPLLLRRPEPPAQPEGVAGGIRDFYSGHMTKEELDSARGGVVHTHSNDVESGSADGEKKVVQDNTDAQTPAPRQDYTHKPIVGPRPEGPLYSGAVLFWMVKKVFLSGVDQDIINMQKKESVLTGDLEEMHARVQHYDNKAEFLYSFMQVMTACTASFTHGANDVANAIGPYATIYQVWSTGALKGSKADVPIWILCFGGVGIALGIWTYGYNIMRNLGNRLTLHSPARGFSMELGAAVTIILATRLKLPVSTTQCITGATVGVGLCSGTWRSINWRMVGWIYMGWIITLPTAGIISGCLTGIIINAPRWGMTN